MHYWCNIDARHAQESRLNILLLMASAKDRVTARLLRDLVRPIASPGNRLGTLSTKFTVNLSRQSTK